MRILTSLVIILLFNQPNFAQEGNEILKLGLVLSSSTYEKDFNNIQESLKKHSFKYDNTLSSNNQFDPFIRFNESGDAIVILFEKKNNNIFFIPKGGQYAFTLKEIKSKMDSHPNFRYTGKEGLYAFIILKDEKNANGTLKDDSSFVTFITITENEIIFEPATIQDNSRNWKNYFSSVQGSYFDKVK